MGSFVRGLGVLAATLVVGAAAACTDSTNFGEARPVDEIPLPERERDRAQDASKPPPRTVPQAPDASADASEAGVDAAPARSALCSEADLILCVEFEGAVKDESDNALQPAMVQGVSFVTGKAGLAGAFGTESAIRFAHAPAYDTPSATIEAWVNLSPAAKNSGVVFDADDRYAMDIQSDGQLRCKTAGGTETGGTVVKGELTHVACTFESDGRIRNYVGGVERDTGSGRLGNSANGGAAIGGNSPSGEPFVGLIDSLRVFRRVRTPAEIAQAAQ